jgi:hypothetical protein
MEAAEWYELRNDRANRINDVLLDSSAKTIAVVVGDSESLSHQTMAVTMANTLSRWCRRVTFFLSKSARSLVPGNPKMLHELISEVMTSADPYGDFHVKETSQFSNDFNYKVVVGQTSQWSHLQDFFWLDSDGWISGYGFGNPKNQLSKKADSNNPVGAAFSAACINSVIFSDYVGLSKMVGFEKWISLFDLKTSTTFDGLRNPTITSPVDLGSIWQIGAGAVGSTFDFILSLLPAKGTIHIIDYDKVSIPNTSSSQIFTASDAFSETKKVLACERALANNRSLIVKTHDKDFGRFINEGHLKNSYPDCILCFANEKNIWSIIQNNEPPIVLHATTSSNWVVNFGRHVPFDEWCIVCRFGIEESHYVPVCSTGTSRVDSKEEEKLGILPFLSPVAATLTLCELIKLSQFQSQYPINSNFSQFSLKNVTETQPMSIQMAPKKDCPVCSNQDISSYHQGYEKSKYYNRRIKEI